MLRIDGRSLNQLRPVTITLGAQKFAEGSALIQMGDTKVLCAVTVEDRVPAFMRNQGRGWITAEYGMLPRSTLTRTPREAAEGKVKGRTQEIQRLIGRSLRAIANLNVVGERSFTVDCDVLQADGGTRTAAITGSYVALCQAIDQIQKRGALKVWPLKAAVAAVSVGKIGNELLLDLCYEEDFHADVDCNVVMTSDGRFVEVQGTAEGDPFPRKTLDALLSLAEQGIKQLLEAQKQALAPLMEQSRA